MSRIKKKFFWFSHSLLNGGNVIIIAAVILLAQSRVLALDPDRAISVVVNSILLVRSFFFFWIKNKNYVASIATIIALHNSATVLPAPFAPIIPPVI